MRKLNVQPPTVSPEEARRQFAAYLERQVQSEVREILHGAGGQVRIATAPQAATRST